MEKFLVITVFSLMSLISSTLQAQNLLDYVELQIKKNDLIAFSSQAVRIRTCQQCPEVVINAAPNTTYWQKNSEVTLQNATNIYVSREYSSLSIFYNQKTMIFDQFVFDGFIEDQPFQRLNNAEK